MLGGGEGKASNWLVRIDGIDNGPDGSTANDRPCLTLHIVYQLLLDVTYSSNSNLPAIV